MPTWIKGSCYIAHPGTNNRSYSVAVIKPPTWKVKHLALFINQISMLMIMMMIAWSKHVAKVRYYEFICIRIFYDKSVDKVHGEMKEFCFVNYCCCNSEVNESLFLESRSQWFAAVHYVWAFLLLLQLFDRTDWSKPSHIDISNIVFICRLSKEWRQVKLWPILLLLAGRLPYEINVRIDHTVQLCTVECVVEWSGLGRTPKECGMNVKPHMWQQLSLA
jgi:hypothetical protein